MFENDIDEEAMMEKIDSLGNESSCVNCGKQKKVLDRAAKNHTITGDITPYMMAKVCQDCPEIRYDKKTFEKSIHPGYKSKTQVLSDLFADRLAYIAAMSNVSEHRLREDFIPVMFDNNVLYITSVDTLNHLESMGISLRKIAPSGIEKLTETEINVAKNKDLALITLKPDIQTGVLYHRVSPERMVKTEYYELDMH